jgi:hypothetical protein
MKEYIVRVNLGTFENTGFAMFRFKDPFWDYFDEIYKKAFNECKLNLTNADKLSGPESITEDIWKAVRKAPILIADISEKSENIFYEIGLAHAIGNHQISTRFMEKVLISFLNLGDQSNFY